MNTIFKIAWRNCWRNRLRSLIVIFTIILGITSSIFMMGFMQSLVFQRIESMVAVQLGDIQIHTPTFNFDDNINNDIKEIEIIERVLQQDPEIRSFSSRFRTEAYAVSAHGQAGVKVLGVNPQKELETLTLGGKLIEGTFLDSELAYPVVIGKKIAEELHLKLGSKIQLSFTKTDAVQTSKNFKVCGIFRAGDEAFDARNVFVPQEKIKKLLGTAIVHEVVISVKDKEKLTETVERLTLAMPTVLVETWVERSPQLYYAKDMMGTINYVLMIIIIAALMFGIVNTLVMSILERKRELGVLMAVGMTNNKVRLMIILESIIYGVIGGPLGLMIGYLIIAYFNVNGLDLTVFAEGMEAFGYDPIVYLYVEIEYYFIYAGFVVGATILGGIYPSRIATKLNPISAIRAI